MPAAGMISNGSRLSSIISRSSGRSKTVCALLVRLMSGVVLSELSSSAADVVRLLACGGALSGSLMLAANVSSPSSAMFAALVSDVKGELARYFEIEKLWNGSDGRGNKHRPP